MSVSVCVSVPVHIQVHVPVHMRMERMPDPPRDWLGTVGLMW